MENYISLDATIIALQELRYTPSGLPIIEMTVEHNSKQMECKLERIACFQILSKIIGDLALDKYQVGEKVHIRGFLTASNQRSSKLMLHVQEITHIE
ncbi:MAG: primosomal replication protein N [Neisseriaceae bacterium]|nr:primosomal replication protein N [Neisseriaceae bacterium]